MASVIVRGLFAALLTVPFLGAPVCAQIQGFSSYKGKPLPIGTYHDTYLMVLEDGHDCQTYDLDVQVRPAKHFADGFITVADVQSDCDLLKHAAASERADPDAFRAHYSATITADRGLSDCYGLLTFVTQGSVGTRLVAIGHLGAGSAKKIDVKLHSQVNSFGSLHVFSRGEEVRSNQHPGPYDVFEYYAGLVKNVKGLPAAELLKYEEIHPYRLSDDGRMLATIVKREQKKTVVVYDLESMKQVSETEVAGAEDFVGYMHWVSDHQVAYVAESHNADFDQNLYVLDAQKGTTKKLVENVIAVVASLPDHPEVLELHTWMDGSVFSKYNVLQEHSYEVEDPTTASYLFDAQGKPRVEIRYRGTKRYYACRPTPDSRWRDLDDIVKQPGLKFNADSSDDLDRVVDIHSVGPDGDTLYISTRLGTDKFVLAAFSMSQGIIKQKIAEHPQYDLTTSDNGEARLLFAKKSPQLLGMIYEGQKPRVIWVHPYYAAVQKSIDATFRDHVNLPVDWSADGNTFIYFSFNDRDPGTFYAFRPKKPELIPLLQLNERLKDKSLGKMIPYAFTSRDGAKIPGYLTLPPDEQPALPPLLVYIHGGPMARDTWGFRAENQFFATRGYAVLQVNYRGSSGYGQAFQTAGLRARLDTVVIDDIADGVRSLINAKKVDPNRIAVMGASFGGWATYLCLAKYPDLFKAGVAISAVSNWGQAIADDRWKLRNEGGAAFWRALMKRQNYSENAKYIDPLRRVAEIKQPVFIIHGENDRVVLATEARAMLKALKKEGAPVEAKSFVHASHSDWTFGDRVERLNEIAGFLQRSLPEPAEVAPKAVATASAK